MEFILTLRLFKDGNWLSTEMRHNAKRKVGEINDPYPIRLPDKKRKSHKNDTALADIDKRLEELQTELLKRASSNADYEKVGDEIYRLRDQKQKLQFENANRDELKRRMTDMSTFLKKQPTSVTEYDEQLVRRLLLMHRVSTIYQKNWIIHDLT